MGKWWLISVSFSSQHSSSCPSPTGCSWRACRKEGEQKGPRPPKMRGWCSEDWSLLLVTGAERPPPWLLPLPNCCSTCPTSWSDQPGDLKDWDPFLTLFFFFFFFFSTFPFRSQTLKTKTSKKKKKKAKTAHMGKIRKWLCMPKQKLRRDLRITHDDHPSGWVIQRQPATSKTYKNNVKKAANPREGRESDFQSYHVSRFKCAVFNKKNHNAHGETVNYGPFKGKKTTSAETVPEKDQTADTLHKNNCFKDAQRTAGRCRES